MNRKFSSHRDEKKNQETVENQIEENVITDDEESCQNDEVIRLNSEATIQEIVSYAYSLFNKFGFDDGDIIPREDKWIVELYANKLAEALGTIDGIWQPYVIGTILHNPYYIRFSKSELEESLDYWSLDEDTQSKIDEALDKIDGS